MCLKYRPYQIFVALFGLFLVGGPASAQDATSYVLADESKLWIDGTSTRSDWTVHAEDIEARFGIVGSGENLQVRSAQVAVRASEIVSGRSTIMDRLIDDALKAEEHPIIRYNLDSAESDGPLKFKAGGKLTLGGETREVAILVNAEPLDSGRIRFTGSHDLKMSDYGLEPPVAMFGALRTGDEVTVSFDLVVTPGN